MTMNAMSDRRGRPDGDNERTQTPERERPRILAGGQLVIHRENAPLRCEICHQSDVFDAETGACRRCAHVEIPAFRMTHEARHAFDVAPPAARRSPPLYFLDEYHADEYGVGPRATYSDPRAVERVMQRQLLGHMTGVSMCVLALGVLIRFCLSVSARGDALITTFLCFVLCVIAFLTMSVFVSAAAQTMRRLYGGPRRE
jgi:hypothetical protein